MPQGLILPSVGLQQDTNMYAYSNGFFYPLSMQDDYEAAKSWPDSFVEVSEEVYLKFTVNQPQGKMRGTDVEGMPCWVDAPPPTKEELIQALQIERQQLLTQADDVMRDWRTELMLDEISETDKSKLSAWMAYKNEVKSVDVLTAPDKVVWPASPEV